MAEQKTGDTKQPIVPRGPRPFAGPAGAAPQARPFLRPATAAPRPAASPFVPPAVPARPALGTAQPPASPPAPIAPPPASVAPPRASIEVPRAMGAAPEPDSIVIDHDPEVLSPEPVSGVPAEVPSVNRPVTNEMVAVDAFDAFDTVWDTTGHSASTDAAQPEASPVDDESLGSGVDAQPLWADEIIGGADPASPTSEPTGATPSIELPSWLADDPVPAPSPEQEYGAPSENTPSADPLQVWSADVAGQARVEMVSEPEPSPFPIATDPRLVHGWRVSAALDRLAQRVRDGEIDVSSVAPEAPDAAVLASVLAALLGGSNKR